MSQSDQRFVRECDVIASRMINNTNCAFFEISNCVREMRNWPAFAFLTVKFEIRSFQTRFGAKRRTHIQRHNDVALGN